MVIVWVLVGLVVVVLAMAAFSFARDEVRLRRRAAAELPAWASQFRRQDSEIDNSFAIAAIGLIPERARSTARCRNSGG